jgi:hypothetical protein
MGDAPFFGYTTKRGYQNAKKPTHTPYIQTFINQLNLCNSSTMQIIARIWHNSRPRKVGNLIWLTLNLIWLSLNRRLPVETWLHCMGISPSYKVCSTETLETSQHCLLECPLAKCAWKAFQDVWQKWGAPDDATPSWPFILLGEAVFEREDDPPSFQGYHIGGYSYIR